jgi:hypothetical protein
MGSFNPDSSITGTAQTGLTNPTYTLVEDFAPSANSRQLAVSALGGTQSNVRANTAGDPFTLTIRKSPYKAIPPKNPTNGSYGNVPLNRVELLFRKGFKIDSAGVIKPGNIRIISELPAGCETNDAINIKALVSFLIGVLSEEADEYSDSLISGILSG